MLNYSGTSLEIHMTFTWIPNEFIRIHAMIMNNKWNPPKGGVASFWNDFPMAQLVILSTVSSPWWEVAVQLLLWKTSDTNHHLVPGRCANNQTQLSCAPSTGPHRECIMSPKHFSRGDQGLFGGSVFSPTWNIYIPVLHCPISPLSLFPHIKCFLWKKEKQIKAREVHW